MKFLLSHYTAEWGSVPDEEYARAVGRTGELVDRQLVADPSTAVHVRVSEGSPVVTAGPIPVAGHTLTAYYLVDCESRDRAIELAASAPAARNGVVEVRPVMTPAGMEM